MNEKPRDKQVQESAFHSFVFNSLQKFVENNFSGGRSTRGSQRGKHFTNSRQADLRRVNSHNSRWLIPTSVRAIREAINDQDIASPQQRIWSHDCCHSS